MAEGIEEYEVDRVLAHRYNARGVFRYLVSWQGYTLHDATWEPEAKLQNARDAINAYSKSADIENRSGGRQRHSYKIARRKLSLRGGEKGEKKGRKGEREGEERREEGENQKRSLRAQIWSDFDVIGLVGFV